MVNRKKAVARQLRNIKSQHGDWTAHNLRLLDDIFTISPDVSCRATNRAGLYFDVISSIRSRGLFRPRVLDLGCLEGAISIFFAQNGFSTVGVDARSSHISKAEFASNVLGLSNRCSWICSDVTDQDFWQSIGKFDIIICSGLLYHIDACDIHPLLVNIFEHCKSKLLGH